MYSPPIRVWNAATFRPTVRQRKGSMSLARDAKDTRLRSEARPSGLPYVYAFEIEMKRDLPALISADPDV